ncbi:hypothetical protein [Gorillibacterium sp. sgz500922]|uniref:hypothetical protein n=1 Tax=Gorillibacterium sp. sgz500922 TaxID=3446694 RepID=UPI003F6685E7
MEHRFGEPRLEGCSRQGEAIVFGKEGGVLRYPLDGETLRRFAYVLIEIENPEDYAVCLTLCFWEEGKEDKLPELFASVGVLPGVRTTVSLPVSYLDGQTLFGKRRPGILKTVIKGNRINPDRLSSWGLRLPPSHQETRLVIRAVRLAEEEPKVELDTLALVDDLGQRADKEWPGKTASREACTARLLELREEAHKHLEGREDEYYGSPDVLFAASGYFRVEREANGRWWLVAPDGRGFFSSGADCVNAHAGGPVNAEGELRDYLVHNLEQAFGEEWKEAWAEMAKSRLIRWKLNTVAAWSDMEFAREAKLPYVAMLDDYPSTASAVYRDFPDVFSEEYQAASEAYARQLDAYRGDRYLIGYFMSNEPNWAFVDRLNLGYELLRNPAELASKKHLLVFLREKYASVAELNKAWGTAAEAFEGLFRLGEFPQVSERGMADLDEFSCRLIAEYIKVPALALKKADPHHLNLGIRYAYISSPTLYSGSEYFDIFSINCYEKSCVPSVQEVYERVGKPVMVGEYHFGAIDRGLPATGIRGAEDQEQRGKAIRRYIEEAAALPCCVGVHYFQFNDQPYLGRFDGENYNIGLVDICNREYAEVTEAVQAANARLYDLRLGKTQPFDEPIGYIPAIFY